MCSLDGTWGAADGRIYWTRTLPVAWATVTVQELGIEYAGGQLLVVDWVAPHGPWDDSLMFVFDGGVLSAEQQTRITLQSDELAAFRFVESDEAEALLRPYVWRRVLAAMATGESRYLES